VASRLAGHVAAVTFVTVGELTKWTLIRHRGPRKLAAMQEFLAALLVLPYDQRVAARWGELQARAQLRGLATCNGKDFADFAQHENLELLLLH
jgi:predicted nucleic acid-binding protein